VLSDEDMRRFFSRCRINLGLGDMHFSRWLTNLKGRDFEVPSTGRGLYLTAYNADLSNYFAIGREIQCYRGVDELIELLWHYLQNQDESREMARQARLRCVAEHQWIHRYRCVLAHLGVFDANPVAG
jgi:spore maturation protein CgeB